MEYHTKIQEKTITYYDTYTKDSLVRYHPHLNEFSGQFPVFSFRAFLLVVLYPDMCLYDNILLN